MRVFVYEHLSGGAAGSDAGEDAAMLAQGLAMRDALCVDLAQQGEVMVSCASAVGLAVPDGAACVRPGAGETVFDFVRMQSQAHELSWIIAPECDGLLAQLCDIVGPERWIGCDATAIRLGSSKRRTLERLAARGLLTPLAFEADPRIVRWVVKPDDGAGATATRLHGARNAAQADAAARSGATVVEPWVEGEPLSLSLLCAGGGAEVLSINRQRIEVDVEGGVAYAGVQIDALRSDDPRSAALRDCGLRVASAMPGLRGYVGIDVVWHARRGPAVIEVNPRLTCAYVGLSAALGRPLAAEILALFRDQERRHEAE
jgi:predicted ATP-grasp superfamily ATP-dependent carboligase